MSESTPDCAIHIKRVDDLEHRVEAHHVRLHKQDNALTEVKMQAGLLDMDFNHHQRDILKSIEAQRDSIHELRIALEARAEEARSRGERLRAIEADVEHHTGQLVWLLRTFTAVGLLAVGAFLTRYINP